MELPSQGVMEAPYRIKFNMRLCREIVGNIHFNRAAKGIHTGNIHNPTEFMKLIIFQYINPVVEVFQSITNEIC
jgi:hypothetical protein